MNIQANLPEGSHETGAAKVVFRLYFAGDAPNSVMAQRNLDALCQEHYAHNYQIELVDVRIFPERAWAEGVIVTPMIVRVSPAPEVQIVGNLSNTAQVLHILGLSNDKQAR